MNSPPMLLSLQDTLRRWAYPDGGLSKVVDAGLNLLFPLSCVACGREGRFLCEDSCKGTLAELQPPHCKLCASPGSPPVCSWCQESPPSYDGISAPYLMTAAVREMILGLKFRNLRA